MAKVGIAREDEVGERGREVVERVVEMLTKGKVPECGGEVVEWMHKFGPKSEMV